MLMIKTGKTRKIKKKNKGGKTQQNRDNDESDGFDKVGDNNSDNDGEFDPDKPNQLSDDEANGNIEDTFHDVEMDEESDREENVERQLNFNAEISLLINYEVISRYMTVVDLKNTLSKEADLLQMTASFFRRVVFQLKQTWIFYQMDFMHYFNEFLQQNNCSNSLMKGIMENASGDSYNERKLRISNDQLKQIITTIVGKFVALQMDNPLLAMEAMFRFQTKEIKDQVLCNYELGVARIGLIGKEDAKEREML